MRCLDHHTFPQTLAVYTKPGTPLSLSITCPGSTSRFSGSTGIATPTCHISQAEGASLLQAATTVLLPNTSAWTTRQTRQALAAVRTAVFGPLTCEKTNPVSEWPSWSSSSPGGAMGFPDAEAPMCAKQEG